MIDGSKSNLANPDLWIRLVYMIIFGLFSGLARIVIFIVAVIQFVLVLLTGQGNRNLGALGEGIAQWTQQTYLFMSFVSDQKPYPFQDWPTPLPDLQDQVAEATADAETSPEIEIEPGASAVAEPDNVSVAATEDSALDATSFSGDSAPQNPEENPPRET